MQLNVDFTAETRVRVASSYVHGAEPSMLVGSPGSLRPTERRWPSNPRDDPKPTSLGTKSTCSNGSKEYATTAPVHNMTPFQQLSAGNAMEESVASEL